MATYTEMVQMIRDWSNRDKEVLSSANIKTFINFAADNIYRDLRIAPLENVYRYPAQVVASGVSRNTLGIPSDAIEFIQLRKKDQNSLTDFVVYDAKPDIRTFYNENIYTGDYYSYARERNNLLVYPDIQDSDEYELYYYRRLPETDARYEINTTNYTTLGVRYDSLTAADHEADPNLVNLTRLTVDGVQYVGALTSNWLRDQNEKLILFGALTEVFTYLDEPDQSQKYAQRFTLELQKLNEEENDRKYKGGNIQLHYRSDLI